MLFAIFCISVLCSCAASVKPMTTPNGKEGFLISCDGYADDWTTCYEAATKSCKGKYQIVDRNESSTATAYGPLVRRYLIAECR